MLLNCLDLASLVFANRDKDNILAGLATYDLSELQIEGDANCQKLVIKTRSIEFMPFYLSPATFLISLSFFAYGLFREDPFIYV
ncbi:bidirectional sugar transporter SWEET1a-like [Rosa chinensis]|uniref:bidirectional sugar transporter SWEET1a-like n=1 Tax=Rosa chinensis TaxID=74649 RepID=UPI000D08BDB3|nr:bidirectional sugar transporter SWEET1a-like [Rosa chinensis]